MNTYIIINGNTAKTINKSSLDDAITYAQNYCDHSHEVIVRQIKSLKISGKELIELNTPENV
mgnify:CR=1 FL=1